MATLRELKGRIGSVASSEKITGAMKMISSAKMHKAESELKRLLPFRRQIQAIIANLLSSDAQFSSPLTEGVPVERMAVVVLGSDDGLCGAYNVNMAKYLKAHLDDLRADLGEGLKVDIYPVGKKMVKAMLKLEDANTRVITDTGLNTKSTGESVKALNKLLVGRFLSKEVQRVDLAYMNYKSMSRQVPTVEQFIPVQPEMFGNDSGHVKPYLFEPDANTIYATVLPMFLLSTLEEVFGENRASEQAARVMAMQSANDNAKKLLDQLQLEYNKLRQQSITNELLDIVGGQKRD